MRTKPLLLLLAFATVLQIASAIEYYRGPFIYGQDRLWDFLDQGKFDGSLVKIENGKAYIKMANGTVRAFDPGRGEGVTVSYLQRAMCKLPENPTVPKYSPGTTPLIQLDAGELKDGPLLEWKNKGRLNGRFIPMNQPPSVRELNGRKAVVFEGTLFLVPLQFQELVSDFYMPEKVSSSSYTVVADLCNTGSVIDRETFLCWGQKDCSEVGTPDFSYGCYEALQWYDQRMQFPQERFPSLNQWHQIAFVVTPTEKNSCEVRIYDDGSLLATQTLKSPKPELAKDNLIFIGCAWEAWWAHTWATRPARPYTGGIAGLKVYDRALTANDLRELNGLDSAGNPSPYNGEVTQTTEPKLTWAPGMPNVSKYTVYFGDDRDAVAQNNQNTMKGTVNDPSFSPGALEEGKTYYWKIIQSSKGKSEPELWSFTASKGRALRPSPANGQETVSTTIPFIKWQPGLDVKAQNLYFGKDSKEVQDGTALVSRSLKPTVNEALLTSLKPEKADDKDKDAKDNKKPKFERAYVPLDKLEPDTVYYWRVEHVDSKGEVVPGQVWSFRTMPFDLEYDGPVSEAFPKGIRQDGFYGRYMECEGGPIIAPPECPDEWMRGARLALQKITTKRPDVARALLAARAATHLGTPLHPDWGWSEFTCASYGGGYAVYREDAILIHETGHQYHMNGCEALEYDFRHRLGNIFDTNMGEQKWIGDYGARNMWENVAVWATGWINNISQDESSWSVREEHRRNDPRMFDLLSDYWPGDTFIELLPDARVRQDSNGRLVEWGNNAGIQYFKRGEGWQYYKQTTGKFVASGSPELGTVDGSSAVIFHKGDFLLWDKKTWESMDGGRPWSVELWAYREKAPSGNESLICLGPQSAAEARFIWGDGPQSCEFAKGLSCQWKNKPAPGKWQHIVYTYSGIRLNTDKSTLKVYVNGKLDSETQLKLDIKPASAVSIGQDFAGAIAFLRFYNYELNPLQLQEFDKEDKWFTQEEKLPVAGKLLVDLDASSPAPYRQTEVWPFYPSSLEKPWLRSWNNRGILGGRFYNELSGQAKSAPKASRILGMDAVSFEGKDHMVGPVVTGLKDTYTVEGWFCGKAGDQEATVVQIGNTVLPAKLLKNNVWQHVAIAVSSGKASAYVDGKAVTIPSSSAARGKPSDRMILGAQLDDRRWSKHFSGSIAQLRVHSDAMTPAQIQQSISASSMARAASPEPAEGASVVVERKPALLWTIPLRPQPSECDVYLGSSYEDVSKATRSTQGTYCGKKTSGAYRPSLKPGSEYFWRVDPLDSSGAPCGHGQVWSFRTYSGLMVDLSAANLDGKSVEHWKNTGLAGGEFVPGSLKDAWTPVVEDKAGARAVFFDSEKYRGKFMVSSFKTPDQLNGNGAFSVAFWGFVKDLPGNSGERLGTVVSWGEQGKGGVECAWGWNEKWGAFRVSKGPEFGFSGSITKEISPWNHNAPLILDWHHIAYVYGGAQKQTLEIYVDGILNRRETVPINVPPDSKLCLGAMFAPGRPGNYFAGYVKELAISGNALEAGAVAQLASGKKASSLKSDWLVLLEANDLNIGPLPSWKNKGSLGGDFSVTPDRTHEAKLDDVAGRKAVTFDGQNAFLQSTFTTPESLCFNKPFTVEAVVYNPGLTDAETIVALAPSIMQKSYPDAATASAANINYGKLTTGKVTQNDGPGAFSNGRFNIAWKDAAPAEKAWHRLAYVCTGGHNGRFKVYADGKLYLDKPYFNLNTLPGYPMSLGAAWRTSTGPYNLFSGSIAELKIYDYERSEEEIANSNK